MSQFSPDEELRLECLRISGGDVRLAGEAFDFVNGATDLTPRQRIDAALAVIEAASVRG
jgi:hypothetical protein